MSQDIVSDALNQMTNALKARKNTVKINAHSKLLLSVLAIAKLKGYIKGYSVEGRVVSIEFAKLNFCKSIKPRYAVNSDEIDKYIKRYLPAKNLGIILISTSKGLMTHQTAQEKNIGGSLIAYMY